jgi:hypothetical protein
MGHQSGLSIGGSGSVVWLIMLLVLGVTSVFTLMAENVDDDLFEDENETAVDGGGDIYERSVVSARRTMSDRQARQAYTLAANHGLTAGFARGYIGRGATLGDFRDIVLDRRAAEDGQRRISPQIRFDGGSGE